MISRNVNLCLHCGAVAAALEICPDCSKPFDPERFILIRRTAEHAVRYGYHYRKLYETEGLDRRYNLEISELWTFVGIAVSSGILGNAAYDLVKTVASRIIDTSGQYFNRPEHDVVSRTLIDQDRFNEFYTYVEQFLAGNPDLPTSLRDALIEEIVADEVAQATTDAIRSRHVGDQLLSGREEARLIEEIARRSLEAQRAVQRRLTVRLQDATFIDLWSDVKKTTND